MSHRRAKLIRKFLKNAADVQLANTTTQRLYATATLKTDGTPVLGTFPFTQRRLAPSQGRGFYQRVKANTTSGHAAKLRASL